MNGTDSTEKSFPVPGGASLRDLAHQDLLRELGNLPHEPMTRAEWWLVGGSIVLGLFLLALLAWWVRGI